MNNSSSENFSDVSRSLSDIAVISKIVKAPHGFFGRVGGRSEGFFSSLNCSRYVGDSKEAVEENLSIVKKCFSSCASLISIDSLKLITLKQIHSNICVEVDEDTDEKVEIEADALVTKSKNIILGVVTADCVPVLFYDPVKSLIGAAHAGWRGAMNGVIESTVKKMVELGSNPEDITAAMGPSIAKESYIIDEEFKKGFSGSGEYFCLIDHNMHFDNPKFCYKKLVKSGLKEKNIEALGIDTYANSDDYFSYRIARKFSDGVCGRQISAICMF